jgi:hypothetical protein
MPRAAPSYQRQNQTDATAMTTNGDTEPAPDRVTVALRAQVAHPQRREAVLEFGQFQMLLRRGN